MVSFIFRLRPINRINSTTMGINTDFISDFRTELTPQNLLYCTILNRLCTTDLQGGMYSDTLNPICTFYRTFIAVSAKNELQLKGYLIVLTNLLEDN